MKSNHDRAIISLNAMTSSDYNMPQLLKICIPISNLKGLLVGDSKYQPMGITVMAMKTMIGLFNVKKLMLN